VERERRCRSRQGSCRIPKLPKGFSAYISLLLHASGSLNSIFVHSSIASIHRRHPYVSTLLWESAPPPTCPACHARLTSRNGSSMYDRGVMEREIQQRDRGVDAYGLCATACCIFTVPCRTGPRRRVEATECHTGA
jgi:hypothetical protein